jgi:hypothetical protein
LLSSFPCTDFRTACSGQCRASRNPPRAKIKDFASLNAVSEFNGLADAEFQCECQQR